MPDHFEGFKKVYGCQTVRSGGYFFLEAIPDRLRHEKNFIKSWLPSWCQPRKKG